MEKAGLQNLSDTARVQRLRLAGNILRLSAARPAKVAINWTPDNGIRRGRPQKVWHMTSTED